jgi:vancomycin resistance protein YoaR
VSRRFRIAIVGALAGVLGAAVTAIAVRDAVYVDKPLPGVVLNGARLSEPVVVTVAGKEHAVGPGRLRAVDERATAAAALAAGRGSFWSRMRALADPSPPRRVVDQVLVVRPAAPEPLVEELAAALPAPRRARVEMRGLEPVVAPAQPGETIQASGLAEALRLAALGRLDAVDAPLAHVHPELSTAAAEAAAEQARTVVEAPVLLRYGSKPIGTLGPRRLARLLRFKPYGDRYVLTFDRDGLANAVRPALAPWRKRATNARFRIEGSTVRILPSRPGLDVNPVLALASVTTASKSGDRVAPLTLRETRADLTTREAEALGIRERISSFTTDMGTSSSNRIHNVQLMAEYIDGTVIAPGQTFSFNESVGPRTTERGFREGQMILGSLLLPSIGGGVCQTATTLFNNAFELGLPIVERHNHSFYISHYPLGRDATVSWGGPDFAFRNDLKSGILIKTSYTSSTLTFSFYGTDPGRKVVSSTGPRVNWRSPQVTYALDPYAPAGSVRTVAGSNQSGFDVTVSRKIYEHGKLVRKDAFTSAYVAVGPTQIYGPGRSIPGPYFVLPRV